MLNATVGVRRLLVRIRPVPTRRQTHRVIDSRSRALSLADGVASRLTVLASIARLGRIGASARLAIMVRAAAFSGHALAAFALAQFAALRAEWHRRAVSRRPQSVSGAHPIRRPESMVLGVRRGTIRTRAAVRAMSRAALGSAFIRERTLPIGVAALVICASLISVAGTAGAGGAGDADEGRADDEGCDPDW